MTTTNDTTVDHDYVIAYSPNAKRAERWRIEDNHALVRDDDGKLLTFPTRDAAWQWVVEQRQEGKRP